MENDYNDIQIIDYINGKLDATATAAFEKAIKQDQDLASEVDFYKELQEVHQIIVPVEKEEEDIIASIEAATKELEDDFFFDKIMASEEETKSEPTKPTAVIKPLKPKRTFRNILSIAASFLVLASAGLWWATSNYNNEQLANRNFENTTISNFVRGSTNNQDIFTKGLAAIEKNNFAEAIQLFETVPTTNEAYYKARLYMALGQFKLGDYANAKRTAQLVVANGSEVSAKAKWLLANIMLANNETGSDFQQLLQEIGEDASNPYYQKAAKDLQKQLSSTWRNFVL